MRTTCKWLQHSAHTTDGAAYSLAQASGGNQCQLPVSHVLPAHRPRGSGKLGCWWLLILLVVGLRTCLPSDMLACCLQTCSHMQTLTGIALLLR